jgi:hypothetical protein
VPEFRILDRDLPTTSDDGAALARVRSGMSVSLARYGPVLAGFPPSPAPLRARRGPGGAPVELTAVGRAASGTDSRADR